MGSTDKSIPWQERVAKKQLQCAEKIPSTWKLSEAFWSNFQTPLADNKTDLVQEQVIRKSGILTDREFEITESYTVSRLLSALATGALTSAEVTLAYCKRAAVAQQLVNCLSETMFDEAQKRAEHLDSLRAQGQLAGPLHGLPISIKDNFHHKGTEATIGMLSFLGEVSSESSPLVQLLLKLGAVIYVKTNVPQTMMTTDSHNNVFGRTLNPRNTMLGPGGSSGGEGALITLRGSPLGVGTDIGEAQGHQIIPLDSQECRIMEANEIAFAIFSLDPGARNHLEASGDPPVPALLHIGQQGEKLRKYAKSTLPDVSSLDRMGQLAALNTLRAGLRESYRKLWLKHDLDICLSPPAQSTAVQHDTFGIPPYTAFLNCLDFPSCILPFGHVGEEDAGQTFALRDDQVGPEYNFQVLNGAPCSVQLFTPNMRDEECLQMAKQIDQCLRNRD
ncbi:hypothetical protein N7532_006486 [Penicillium argentinense]|uniref:Amidase domain-containing protein n=1 Tax=Penicillium argentinense TaxID=1131581 RepID=A0A9W9FFW6_9EURO|nr:uncharacterized protein N7532_006486 [Penicillium argentinense]KAJ5099485.1 hypothetical protein N7532_006486 [Penicillium argentinense]